MSNIAVKSLSSVIRMNFRKLLLVVIFILRCLVPGFSQTGSCPPNISFENGSFANWQAATGKVTDVGFNNIITVAGSAPVANRHTLYDRNSNPGIDPYGKFPIVSPEGGQYSVRLGNAGIGAQAERLSYTLKVPANQPDFTLTYYYAVVFEDPKHEKYQQPRFTVRVFDVSANKYIPCASFEYIATSNLPGFKKSTTGRDIYFKDWAPVTINLSEYSGKEIKLEFTTADCTELGHFGYAYVDVSEECLGAITGNSYCGNPNSITLKGPSGFQSYNWFDANLKTLIGKGQSLNVSPAPPASTRFALQVIPYPGFGCLDTVYTTIQQQSLALIVTNPPSVCIGTTVDLTTSSITSGSAPGLTYSYWKDSNAAIKLDDPEKITTSGQYYIQAISPAGCSSIKAVVVVVNPLPEFTITSPAAACAPQTVDITDPRLVANAAILTYTYWKDASGTIPLTNPKAVSASGTYYIKGASASCFTIKPITVNVNPLVDLVIVNPTGVCAGTTVDLTAPSVTAGSATALSYSYWKDSNATSQLESPNKVSASGQYYIKALSSTGCFTTKAVNVVINALPEFIITSPVPVCAPLTIDITDTRLITSSSALTFTYWMDAGATIPVATPKALSVSGIYFIKGTSTANCSSIRPIQVTIYKQPVFSLLTPEPDYFPGTIDLTKLVNKADKNLTYRYSYSETGNSPIDQPEKVGATGTYYVIGVNENGCELILPVFVKIVPRPGVFVPTAFTPLLPTNNRLFPFLVAVKTLLNFKIYNKWGNLVYQTSAADPGWDGQFKSELHFFETYTWYLDGLDELDNYFKTTGKSILIK